VDNSASPNHLLSEQIDQQHGGVARWTVTAQANGTAKEVAVWTAALADTTFRATRALVHRSRHDRLAALEILAQALRVRVTGLVAKTERALLMGA
jgi:hypothetical protein